MIQDLERDSLFDSKESRSGSGSIPATISDLGSFVVDNLEKRLSILQGRLLALLKHGKLKRFQNLILLTRWLIYI
jgi:hypothetical protein